MSPVKDQYKTNENNNLCVTTVLSLISKEVDFLDYYSTVCRSP
jgi:hypothetical protein